MNTRVSIQDENEICDYISNSNASTERSLQIKGTMYNVINTENCTKLNIIDESSDMITVSVGKLYSEDERKFITSLDLSNVVDPLPNIICRFCQMTFKTLILFSEHKKSSQCCLFWKQPISCTACSVVYESESKLFLHTRLHRRHCQIGYGKFFRKLECCLGHENCHHTTKIEQLTCRGCSKAFKSCNKRTQHMNQHFFARRFVCSFCRLQFITGLELEQHWLLNRSTCGVLKFNNLVNSSKGEYVLANTLESALDISKLRLPSIKKIQSINIADAKDSNFKLSSKNLRTEDITANNKNPQVWLDYSNTNKTSIEQAKESIAPGIIKFENMVIPSESFHLSPSTKILPKQITETPTPREEDNYGVNLFSNSLKKHLFKLNQVWKLIPNSKVIPIKLRSNPNNVLKRNTKSHTKVLSSEASKLFKNLRTVKSANTRIFDICGTSSVFGIIGKGDEEFNGCTDKIKESRNLCLTNDTMMLIEKIPEKHKVIENIKNQIHVSEPGLPKLLLLNKTEEKDRSNVFSTVPNSVNIGEVKYINENFEPSSLYLKINVTHDQKLMKARRTYPNYRFSWICPHCPRQYELKYAFREHLVSMHGATKELIDKLLIEIKPFKLRNPVIAQAELPSTTSQLSVETEIISSTTCHARKVLGNSKKEVQIVHTSTENESDSIFKIQQEFECRKCQCSLDSAMLLTQHQKEGCSRPKRYECNVCLKRFAASSTLNCHMTIHTGELPHQCNFCNKRFRTRGQVTVHHRTHTGERPFTCQVCLLGFTHRETLISHLSRHIGMKRYKCYGCEKTFSCISGLRTHRDVRPETCGQVKFSPRAIGPRVRVIKGNVIFESQPKVNPYLRSDDPPN